MKGGAPPARGTQMRGILAVALAAGSLALGFVSHEGFSAAERIRRSPEYAAAEHVGNAADALFAAKWDLSYRPAYRVGPLRTEEPAHYLDIPHARLMMVYAQSLAKEHGIGDQEAIERVKRRVDKGKDMTLEDIAAARGELTMLAYSLHEEAEMRTMNSGYERRRGDGLLAALFSGSLGLAGLGACFSRRPED